MTQVSDTSIIYTTHCLKEAERICDKIVILIRGQTTCIGTLNNLKNDINGYKLVINGSSATFEEKKITEILELEFENSADIVTQGDQIWVELDKSVLLSKIYSVSGDLKRKKYIDDFWVNEMDLNDVFERCLIGEDDDQGEGDYGYNGAVGMNFGFGQQQVIDPGV